MKKALDLIAKAFKINTIPTNNNQRSSLIPRNNQIAQPDMNTSQDIKMQMVDDNVGNQIIENMNGLSVVSEISNQYGNGNVVTALAEGNGNGIDGNPIRCYNCRGEGHYASNCTTAADAHEETERVQVNCTLEDTLQQASTSRTQSDNPPVYDLDGSTEVPKDENCYDHDISNMLTHEVQYTDLQTELDCTKEKLENCINKKEKEYAVLWEIIGMEVVISNVTSNTLDPVSPKLEDENVYEPKGTTNGTRTNTMFTKQTILGKLPSSAYKPKLYSVTPFPKSLVLPKVDKTNSLSKPVTSNSAPSTRESKVMQTVNVIAPRIFRVNNIAKTRRPHPRRNSNTDRVPSKSKSSCLSNNFEKIEENHRNSQIPKNQKHIKFDSHDVSDRVGKSIRSFVRRIIQMEKIKLSFAVTTADAFDKRQQQEDSTSSTSTLATTISANGNFDL
ncbi:reverse transcriptase domain-containing protein [Tanacetum coccineum]